MKNPLKNETVTEAIENSGDKKAAIIKIGVALAVTAGAVVALKVLNRKKTDNNEDQD